MENLFKKAVYTGVGLVTSTAEKYQSQIDELVEKGKLSEEEGKKIVDGLFNDFDQKKEDFEGRLKNIVDKVVGSFDFASRNEIATLKAKVAELEAKLEAPVKKAPAKRTTTRKATPKKTTTAKKEA